MLKFFFWTLLLVNAGLAAYELGYFDGLVSNGREPTRMSNQFNADHLRLVPPPVAEPEPENETGPEPESEAPIMPEQVSLVQAEPVLACTEIGNFSQDDASRFVAQLAPLALGERLSQHTVSGNISHVVYIPSQGDREGAERKADELRRLGITDFFIIQDNSRLRWGISLGVFKQEDAARTHLERLNRRGVRTGRVGRRSSSAIVFQLHGLDAESRAAVGRIATGFPRQEMRACA